MSEHLLFDYVIFLIKSKILVILVVNYMVYNQLCFLQSKIKVFFTHVSGES